MRQHAQECLDLLVNSKLASGNIYILQTNHLMYHQKPFYPADWWYVRQDNHDEYIKLFELLPYAIVTSNGIIGMHGLPSKNLTSNSSIETGSNEWEQITWGRLKDVDQQFINETLASNNAKIIIRSHDHYADRYTFNHKVLTFATSNNLPDTKRLIAVVDLNKPINDVTDIELIALDKVKLGFSTDTKDYASSSDVNVIVAGNLREQFTHKIRKDNIEV